jgi:hypothetical protein
VAGEVNYAERKKTWDRCWSGNTTGVPQYFAPHEWQQFVRLRGELFYKYLRDEREISEFGCGVGHNLIPLMGMGKRLRGFDWAPSATRYVAELGIEARYFDMLEPDYGVKLEGAVFTVHALEQLWKDWEPFLRYLIAQKPSVCLHIEPIEEFYDPAVPHDAACLAYHRKRHYLTGFYTRLRELEEKGVIELLEVRKSAFGGMNHDAYSVLVWRTL